jgi:hypothetical protein
MNKEKIIEFIVYMVTKPYRYQLSRFEKGKNNKTDSSVIGSWLASIMGSGMIFVWFFGLVSVPMEMLKRLDLPFKAAPYILVFTIILFIINLNIVSKFKIPENQFYHDLFWIIYFSPITIVLFQIIYSFFN